MAFFGNRNIGRSVIDERYFYDIMGINNLEFREVNKMKREYIIDACSGKSIDVLVGQNVTIIDIEGGQVVDFFAESAESSNEFLSTGVTIDCNESLRLKVGDYIYSNLYRSMFQITYDEVGEHDLIHPCCRPEMYDFFYHNGEGHSNCLDNINHEMGETRPIIHPVNLFMYTKINTDGTISVKRPISKAGSKIVLKAEMNMRLGVAACSVSESDCNSGKCTSIQIIIEDQNLLE